MDPGVCDDSLLKNKICTMLCYLKLIVVEILWCMGAREIFVRWSKCEFLYGSEWKIYEYEPGGNAHYDVDAMLWIEKIKAWRL